MDVKAELERIGCIYSGHFVGASTKHLAGYCNIDPLLPHVSLVDKLVRQIVENFKNDNVETVATPAVGAIPFSHWGAHHLKGLTGKEVFGVWGDKVKSADTKAFAFERAGFTEAVKGKRVLILEDIINQMFSIKAMIKTVEEAGGIIVGVGAVAAQRTASAEAIGVQKFVSLTTIAYDVWTAEDCIVSGLCSQNVPIITDVGHGDDYQKTHPDYAGGYTHLLEN